MTPAYQRVLLKLSGEALMGSDDFGIDAKILHSTAESVQALVAAGVEVALVIGGGNIFRGAGLTKSGIHKVTADHIGMLATAMNALAMQDMLKRLGLQAHVLSAFAIEGVCEKYQWWQAVDYLAQKRVVLFAAGTGNPLFTTDSAASLRAIEISADLMVKATKVDGVYSADPMQDANAERFTNLSYDEAIQRQLKVMDSTAVILCRDHQMPLRVLNMLKPQALHRAVVLGENEGTLIHS